MEKKVDVTIGKETVVYNWISLFCPVCGNQTIYESDQRSVVKICLHCKVSWQIRDNTKSSNHDIQFLSENFVDAE